MKSSRRSQIIGLSAAAATTLLIVASSIGPATWQDSSALAILGIPFSVGLIFASIPFGGLHYAPPVIPVAIIASAVNGFLYGGLAWLAGRARQKNT